MKKLLLLLSFIYAVQVSAQIITTVAGYGGCCNPIDGGQATASTLYYPTDVAVDASGNLFIAEANSIRKVTASSGIITTVAGTGQGAYTGDGGQATAAQIEAGNVALDVAGNIYIADWSNKVLRKVTASTGIITTIAGGGSNFSASGIPATSAKLVDPYNLTIDAIGNIFMCDGHRIRKINTAGIITTLAGTYNNNGYSGDGGPATAALLNTPMGIAVDAIGNVYISDTQNERIRKINTQGIISTVVGNGNYGYSSNGTLANNVSFPGIEGIALDASGNLFIACGKAVVRMVNTAGIINTVAGDTIYGYTGDGGLATSAELQQPVAVAAWAGNLFIVDYNADVVRKVTNAAQVSITMFNAQSSSIKLYPNPANNKITIDANDVVEIKLFNVVGNQITNSKQNQLDVSNVNDGVYFIQVQTKQGTSTQKIIIQH